MKCSDQLEEGELVETPSENEKNLSSSTSTRTVTSYPATRPQPTPSFHPYLVELRVLSVGDGANPSLLGQGAKSTDYTLYH